MILCRSKHGLDFILEKAAYAIAQQQISTEVPITNAPVLRGVFIFLYAMKELRKYRTAIRNYTK
jgi:hypothetical protein